jgi:tRNA A-37 threonylcarbamoyl transferase component Bud32
VPPTKGELGHSTDSLDLELTLSDDLESSTERPQRLEAPTIPSLPPVGRPKANGANGTQPANGEGPSGSSPNELLGALEKGSSDDLEDLVDAIIGASGSSSDHEAPSSSSSPESEPPPRLPPRSSSSTPRIPEPKDEDVPSPWSHEPPAMPETPVPSGSDPGAPSGPVFSPGDVIGDRYEIIGMLGEGGVSHVFRAMHRLLKKEHAIKVMRPELSAMESARERFKLEAQAVCRLDHPNIARVTDFGQARDGRMYLVMELVDGESLATILERTPVLPPSRALFYTVQLLRGLRHAHDNGVVHRDLKPDNVVVATRDGEELPKILDFGIAKIINQPTEGRAITQVGSVFGTPRYMSPEQAAGEPVDHRADIYALGVILYQLLSGRLPFDGSSTVQILSRVLTQPPPAMALVTPTRTAGREIEELVMKALEKERADRYDSATDFLMAIEAVARKHRLFG